MKYKYRPDIYTECYLKTTQGNTTTFTIKGNCIKCGCFHFEYYPAAIIALAKVISENGEESNENISYVIDFKVIDKGRSKEVVIFEKREQFITSKNRILDLHKRKMENERYKVEL